MPVRGDDDCEDQIEKLRRDLQEKHKQNRDDIHAVKNEQQKIVLDLAQLEGKIDPLVDNGQPGLVSRISNKLDEVMETITNIRIAQGMDTGRRGEYDWIRGVVASAIVGLIIVLAEHFWHK